MAQIFFLNSIDWNTLIGYSEAEKTKVKKITIFKDNFEG